MPDRFIGIIFTVIGLFIISGNLIWTYNTLQFLAAAKTAEGRVVKLNFGSSHPEISSATEAGKK